MGIAFRAAFSGFDSYLALFHSERPKLNRVLAVLSAVGLNFHEVL